MVTKSLANDYKSILIHTKGMLVYLVERGTNMLTYATLYEYLMKAVWDDSMALDVHCQLRLFASYSATASPEHGIIGTLPFFK
jgi:hypothetical protein